MKTTFTFILSIFTLPLLAQITIDQNNFPLTADYVDNGVRASGSGVALPSEGASQSWDYSTLTTVSTFQTVWTDASGDPNYPNALHSSDREYTFAGLLRTGSTYHAIDADGWYEEGRFLDDTVHSITLVTGGANDILAFPEQVQDFQGRINFLDFPVAYGNTWTQSHIEDTDFMLTVAAFSFNNTPGMQRRRYTETRTVVGEGTLVIPDENGNPSGALNALLLKVEDAFDLDSTFLGGQVAPEALVTAFGSSQGEITESNDRYLFYVPGFPQPVMSFELDASGTAVDRVFYRPSAASLSTGISDVREAGALSVYPNPAAAGDVLRVPLTADSEATTIELVDALGRLVFTRPLVNNQGTASVELPLGMDAGLYTAVVRNGDSKALNIARVVVQ